MPAEEQKQQEQAPSVDEHEGMIEIGGEWRPANKFYLAVAATHARNVANGWTEPYEPKSIVIGGELISKTVSDDRGPY